MEGLLLVVGVLIMDILGMGQPILGSLGSILRIEIFRKVKFKLPIGKFSIIHRDLNICSTYLYIHLYP